jgi:magnesium chelatase family protein
VSIIDFVDTSTSYAASDQRADSANPDITARRYSPEEDDRIDLQIEVPAVSAADLVLPAPAEGSAEAATRVAAARQIQRTRYGTYGQGAPRTNAEASGQILEAVAMPDQAGVELMRRAATAMSLSARGFHRTLRVARTLADLDGAERVGRAHVAEALGYRREMMQQRLAA